MANKNLNEAGAAKRDEFYTQLADIQEELRHYKEHFRGKTVLCNCDDPRVSMFFHYFAYNFEALGLKRLITTCYKSQERDLFSTHDCEKAIWLEYFGDRNGNRIPDPEKIVLFRNYTPEAYPRYCNFDAIEVSRTEDIPCDYDGLMGVPITFLDKYNPDQFEIVGVSLVLGKDKPADLPKDKQGGPAFYIKENGAYRRLYDRIVIRRRPQ